MMLEQGALINPIFINKLIITIILPTYYIEDLMCVINETLTCIQIRNFGGKKYLLSSVNYVKANEQQMLFKWNSL